MRSLALVALVLLANAAAAAGEPEVIYELRLDRGASADAFTLEVPHAMRVTSLHADCRAATGNLRVVGPGGEFGAVCVLDESSVDAWGVVPAGTYVGSYAFWSTGGIHFRFVGVRA